jgi:hypothetical protein
LESDFRTLGSGGHCLRPILALADELTFYVNGLQASSEGCTKRLGWHSVWSILGCLFVSLEVSQVAGDA